MIDMDIKKHTNGKMEKFKQAQHRDKVTQFKRKLEELRKINEQGFEYWDARELQEALGYATWRRFEGVIEKAKITAENSGMQVTQHFLPPPSKNDSKKGRPGVSYHLSRLACYYIAQNADPRIEEVSYAKQYFAIQTRRQEKADELNEDMERIEAREGYTKAVTELAQITIKEKGFTGKEHAILLSKGDQGLYGGLTTSDMKERYGTKGPLADHEPTVILKGKEFATSITNHNIKNMTEKHHIVSEHIKNNKSIREVLLESDIVPEDLPPLEHIKHTKKKVKLMNTETQKIREQEQKEKIMNYTYGASLPHDVATIVEMSNILKTEKGDIVIYIGSKAYGVTPKGMDKLQEILDIEKVPVK